MYYSDQSVSNERIILIKTIFKLLTDVSFGSALHSLSIVFGKLPRHAIIQRKNYSTRRCSVFWGCNHLYIGRCISQETFGVVVGLLSVSLSGLLTCCPLQLVQLYFLNKTSDISHLLLSDWDCRQHSSYHSVHLTGHICANKSLFTTEWKLFKFCFGKDDKRQKDKVK